MKLPTLVAALAVLLPLASSAPLEQKEIPLSPLILSALERDLGLDATEAPARFDFEKQAGNIIKELRSTLKDSFAGAWVEDGKVINVAISDKSSASIVEKAGATPKIVNNDLSKLQKAKEALDDIHKLQPRDDSRSESGIALYYVDVVTNKLIIDALAESVDEAKALAEDVGLLESEFKVREVSELFKPYTLLGGGGYAINKAAACSVGFNVRGGFISAGHCGRGGDSVTYLDGTPVGRIERSNFPGSDMSYISTLPSVQGPGFVGAYGIQGDVPVRGSNSAPVGAGICRSGTTTGWRCGSIQAYDVTVNYSDGPVYGTILTNACAQPGDSGGSMVAGDQAQGVLSGGAGDCTSGGQTVYQGVNAVLQSYGLSLTTA